MLIVYIFLSTNLENTLGLSKNNLCLIMRCQVVRKDTLLLFHKDTYSAISMPTLSCNNHALAIIMPLSLHSQQIVLQRTCQSAIVCKSHANLKTICNICANVFYARVMPEKDGIVFAIYARFVPRVGVGLILYVNIDFDSERLFRPFPR